MNNKSELARQLRISRTALYRYIKRGMPTDSVEAARHWRRNNLDIMQTKEWRVDDNPGIRRERPDYSYDELVAMVNDGYNELIEKVMKG